jgi:plasmid stabilization system protein ParE
LASVIVTPTAQRNLESLIQTHSLPTTTRERFQLSLAGLHQFPLMGAPLEGRWAGFRFVLGPWRWMIVVYHYAEPRDQVGIVAVLDARSARSPTAGRR